MREKVVLAFSGGLDTSFCAIYLAKEKNLDIYTAIVNTGGFSQKELDEIAKKAKNLGIRNHTAIDVTDNYYQNCVRYMIYGNVLRNNTYPLSVSSERVFQAIAVLEYAKKIGAKYVAHGSTGAGNDQVRFDLAFNILASEIQVITPIRDLKLLREEEIDYLKKQGIKSDWKKAEYSINKGIWGTSIGGKETLSSNKSLPEEAYPSQLKAKNEKVIKLHFKNGELVGLDTKKFKNPVDVIKELEKIASPYAIGRDIHVGDTIIGIKGRVGFEAAAPMIIIKGHHLLEKHVLTKWQQYWKDQLANWYGMMLHEALYFDPVMRNMEKFLEDSQENVTGTVIVKLLPYRFELIGIESEHDLMNAKFGSYGEANRAWSGDDVKGFTKIIANQLNIYYSVNQKKNKTKK